MPPKQSQDATQSTSQSANHVKQNKQQKAMQQSPPQSDARTAKRIKTEHGEETSSTLSQAMNGGQADHQNQSLVLPTSRQNSSHQMGPPLNSRPSTLNQQSYNNDAAGSPAANLSTANSPSPQPSQSTTPRTNVGPGRIPYQFGVGLPSPGITFNRTPTTGSFLVSSGSGSNSRQHTPTEQGRTASRASPAATSGNKNAAAPSPNPAPAPAPTSRKDGVDQLQDLLSISGVDLRAEEEAAQRTPIARASFQSANAAAVGQLNSAPQLRQSPFYLEIYALSRQIHRIAAKHGLRVDPEVLNYLSLAAKTRFQNLLEAMIASSRHRTWSSHLRPPPMYERGGQAMYHEQVHDDPMKLLAALTKVEKRQEQDARQARILREEREANNTTAGTAEEEGGAAAGEAGDGASSGQATPADRAKEGEKKGKKLGAAATARNMSDDKRLKLANKTAAQALGINTNSKAWMLGGSGSGANSPFGGKSGLNAGGSRLPKPRFAPTASALGGDGSGTGGNAQEADGGNGQEDAGGGLRSNSISVGGWGDLAARQRLKEEEEKLAKNRVNLQDALHALEMERSGGAGRGSGEVILYQTRVLGRPPSRKL